MAARRKKIDTATKTKRRFVVYLQVSSYQGISIGAEHWYGSLVRNDSSGRKQVELRRPLTRREATALNKKDGFTSYEAGILTERFDSTEEIIELAIATYREHFPNALALVRGSEAVAEPREILHGQATYMKRVNALAKRCEKLNWDDNYHELMQICADWDEINKKIGVSA